MDRTGQMLGSYQIQQAQSSTCWIGTHRLIHRPVELIFLSRARGERRDAVLDAAAFLDRIRSTAVARVYDLIPDPDEEDALWVVQEHLPPQTLAQATQSASLPEAGARAICDALLPALAEIHDHKYAHGDLSPARIRLTDRGPVLTGFVEARVEAPAEQYLAPELWSRRRPSPTSDVYAFGSCLYQALTSAPPFPRGLPRAEYGRLHKEQGIPDIRNRRPDLPPGLVALIQQATIRKPRERPRNARALMRIDATHLVPLSGEDEHTQELPQLDALPPAPPPTAPRPEPVAHHPPDAPPPAEEALTDDAEITDEAVSGGSVSGGSVSGGSVSGGSLLALGGLGLAGVLAVGVLVVVVMPTLFPGLLHNGPRLSVTNPSEEKVTVACSAGPEQERVGAILDPGEVEEILLADVPVACIAFTADQTIKMRWHADVLPPAGQPWEATVGEDGFFGTEGNESRELDATDQEALAAIPLNLLPDPGVDTAVPDTSGPDEAEADPEPPARQNRVRTPRAPAADAVPESEPVPLQVSVDGRRRRMARGVDVYVDGDLVGEAPVVWAVTPGTHVVRWVKASRLDKSCTITVTDAGASIQIDPAAPACPGETPASAPDSGSTEE